MHQLWVLHASQASIMKGMACGIACVLLHKRTHQCALVPVVWSAHECRSHHAYFIGACFCCGCVMRGRCTCLHSVLMLTCVCCARQSLHNIPLVLSAPSGLQVSCLGLLCLHANPRFASACSHFRLGLPRLLVIIRVLCPCWGPNPGLLGRCWPS
jgi:hypothetical protein